jgi:hypothetical protein
MIGPTPLPGADLRPAIQYAQRDMLGPQQLPAQLMQIAFSQRPMQGAPDPMAGLLELLKQLSQR